MRKLERSIVAVLLGLLAAPVLAQTTVLSAARIHTMDTARPLARAMAFDASGRILALGDADELQARYPQARRLDVGSATVVPGLIDAHAHVGGLGFAMLGADLVGTASKAEIIERLRAKAAQLKPGEWLLGNGWDQNDWPQQSFPTAAELDVVFPDRPVWLSRVDGHAGWANSAAMRAVPRDLAGNWQPDGGMIQRDAAGKPNGIFIDNAMLLVEHARPAPDEATSERALALGMQAAVEHGLTGVHDAGITLAELRRYQRLADRGQMPLRIYAMADGNSDALESLCRNGLYRHPSGRLQMRAVKLYADGALGSRGAAMLEDYSDDHGNRGLLVMSADELAVASAKAKRCGVQVATHAIGDRGNRLALDTYAHALGADVAGDHRWRVEHAQILAPADLARFAQLHVIASMQPTHATSDMPWAQERVGAQRIVGAYAWRQLRDSGARLAFGSDFPVESVDPRLGLYSAVSRADGEGKPAGGWMPQEKLNAFEALRGFTLDAAYAGFGENELGSLAPGKRADFVVLAEDPLAVPDARLRTLDVRATYVDGRPVYEAGKAASAAAP
ncbi:amidohydrolase [Thermomonas aquatica]|uniref:Amidohydrolase n=1 Tax=Thermomonas aquatica TaxID=2202149 RepID=A0A5B7ZT04_9GAMM|nr:amidohydrolase [Thermomonas aquatica]QDA58068.1 amidohydrolase [Thermomonas aquatica]